MGAPVNRMHSTLLLAGGGEAALYWRGEAAYTRRSICSKGLSLLLDVAPKGSTTWPKHPVLMNASRASSFAFPHMQQPPGWWPRAAGSTPCPTPRRLLQGASSEPHLFAECQRLLHHFNQLILFELGARTAHPHTCLSISHRAATPYASGSAHLLRPARDRGAEGHGVRKGGKMAGTRTACGRRS